MSDSKLMTNSVGYSNIASHKLLCMFSWQIFIDCRFCTWGYRGIQGILTYPVVRKSEKRVGKVVGWNKDKGIWGSGLLRKALSETGI